MTPDGLFGLLSSVSCGAFVLATDQTVVYWNRRAREILGYRPDRVVGRRCSGIVPEVEDLTLTSECEGGCLMLRSLRAGMVPGRARIRMRCSWGEWKWLTVTPMVVSGVEDDGPLLVYLFGDSGDLAVSANVQRLVALGTGVDRRSEDASRYERPTTFVTRDSDPEAEETEDGVLDRVSRAVELGTGRTGEDQVSDGPVSRGGEPRPREVHLTARGREVLSYLALGWETRYIAGELGVSWYTARNHIENIRRKLGASSRLEAVMVAMRLGLIPAG